MDKTYLIEFLSDKNTYRCGWSNEYIETSFETMPSEFIIFAENDLQSNLDHKYINALSNAKRALDCQADRLLKLFGYYNEAQDKRWGFPEKLELIKKFNIIAPRVLNKINMTRNLMEHQFIKPNMTQVEDFLDIVSLFLASTDQYTSKSLASVDYINEDEKKIKNHSEISITIDNKNERIIISTYQNKPWKEIKLEVKRSDKEYVEIYKLHLQKTELI